MSAKTKKHARKKRNQSKRSAGLAVTSFREQHGLVERVVGQIADSDGAVGTPLRAATTLDLMQRASRISRAEYLAGLIFGQEYDRGRFEPMKCSNADRIGTGGELADPVPPDVMQARAVMARTLAALGGRKTPVADIVWSVCGEQITVKAYVQRQPFPLNDQSAAGMLKAGLGILAVHYRIERPEGSVEMKAERDAA